MTRFEAAVSVLRDIVRSALTGLIVGVVVLGPGGRIVMRLAALLDPSSAGRATENGNRIGAITLEGTAVLIIFGGLIVGLAMSVVWVAIQEWIPGRSLGACGPVHADRRRVDWLPAGTTREPRLPDPGAGRADPRPAARTGRDRRVRVCRRWRLARPAPAAARSPADTDRRRLRRDDPRRPAVPGPRRPHLPGARVSPSALPQSGPASRSSSPVGSPLPPGSPGSRLDGEIRHARCSSWAPPP